jgi:NNP family nitrate/nitrite transporter-like MFS transporter
MYWVLGSSVLISFMVTIPRMEVFSPGKGIMASRGGTVTEVSETAVVVDGKSYPVLQRSSPVGSTDDGLLVFPRKDVWQEPVVETGQKVKKKDLLVRGVTRIYFQANVWIFAVLVILLGSIWGIGKAAVYKHIPDYFSEEVGVVGGMVGVLGGLGGFFCPIIFGYLLEWTGLWTSCWMFMFALSGVCLLWMHKAVRDILRTRHPEDMRQIEASL